jgi:hypothetical protein
LVLHFLKVEQSFVIQGYCLPDELRENKECPTNVLRRGDLVIGELFEGEEAATDVNAHLVVTDIGEGSAVGFEAGGYVFRDCIDVPIRLAK